MGLPIDLDDDKRRRITGIVFDGTEPKANYLNALVFSLTIDSLSRFIPTRDTTFLYHRTDASNSIFNTLIFMRKVPIGTIPLIDEEFFEGGVAVTSNVVNNVQSAVEIIPKTQIYDSTTKKGVNGWKLAKVRYRTEDKTVSDLFEGLRPPLLNLDPTNNVMQLAMVLDTTDTVPVITGHVHFDLIEI